MRRGFSLVEVCVAMAVLSLFVLIASALESQGFRSLKRTQHRQAAERLASDLEERLRGGDTVPAEGQPEREGWPYDYSVHLQSSGHLGSYEIFISWPNESGPRSETWRRGQKL